jgi:stage V sporulation protein D (sporulation-specific penicillin-binding protein)
MVVMTGLGTGGTARPYGYSIGGKTGTAETLPRGNEEYVVSFYGFAPVDDPQVAVYVVINRANQKRQGNHSLPCNIVREIMQEVLPYMNIYMDQPVTEEEREVLEQKGLEITYRED